MTKFEILLFHLSLFCANVSDFFSKLEYIKRYLGSSMVEEKLNVFALLSIKYEFLNNSDFDEIIDDLIHVKVERKRYLGHDQYVHLLLYRHLYMKLKCEQFCHLLYSCCFSSFFQFISLEFFFDFSMLGLRRLKHVDTLSIYLAKFGFLFRT